MKRLVAVAAALIVQGASAFAPVDYARLYKAIAIVESDDGKTSENRYQLTPAFVADIRRITGEPFPKLGVYDAAYSRKAMLCYWVYYGSRYEARTGRPATAEILAKMHRVGYKGLWTRKATADGYWRRVRKHYKKGTK